MRNRFYATAVMAAMAFGAFGCQSEDAASQKKENQASTDQSQHVTRAIAVVNPRSNSEVVGAVTFTEVPDGIRVIADVGGLSPGKHGFHIHEHGDCSATDASSAGGHFNPYNKKHGGPDSEERHAGDLGNIIADESGFAHYDRVDSLITLNGENGIIGKSVIIHEGEDDLETDPTGNAGARLGCGEIVVAETAP